MENSEQPIYPISENEKDRLDANPNISYKGLTKREYFAGLAMQGLISNPNIIKPSQENFNSELIIFQRVAIKYADALLKELEK